MSLSPLHDVWDTPRPHTEGPLYRTPDDSQKANLTDTLDTYQNLHEFYRNKLAVAINRLMPRAGDPPFLAFPAPTTLERFYNGKGLHYNAPLQTYAKWLGIHINGMSHKNEQGLVEISQGVQKIKKINEQGKLVTTEGEVVYPLDAREVISKANLDTAEKILEIFKPVGDIACFLIAFRKRAEENGMNPEDWPQYHDLSHWKVFEDGVRSKELNKKWNPYLPGNRILTTPREYDEVDYIVMSLFGFATVNPPTQKVLKKDPTQAEIETKIHNKLEMLTPIVLLNGRVESCDQIISHAEAVVAKIRDYVQSVLDDETIELEYQYYAEADRGARTTLADTKHISLRERLKKLLLHGELIEEEERGEWDFKKVYPNAVVEQAEKKKQKKAPRKPAAGPTPAALFTPSPPSASLQQLYATSSSSPPGAASPQLYVPPPAPASSLINNTGCVSVGGLRICINKRQILKLPTSILQTFLGNFDLKCADQSPSYFYGGVIQLFQVGDPSIVYVTLFPMQRTVVKGVEMPSATKTKGRVEEYFFPISIPLRLIKEHAKEITIVQGS